VETVKPGYLLEVVLGVLLTASPTYAQVMMKSGPTGGSAVSSGNRGLNGHIALATFRGGSGMRANFPVQRNTGMSPGFHHPGFVGDRFSGGRGTFFPRRDFGDRRGFRGGHFDHGFGHSHNVIVFGFGAPFFGVPWCYYPAYGYYNSTPYYAPDYGPGPASEYTPNPDTQTEQYTNQDADSYYQPGYQWGGELKLYHVTMDQFVAYLKSYILNASPVQQAAFRSGFVAQFGAVGQTVYDQAVEQAIQQNPVSS